ncbi:uncharacterized protein LOC127095599 [Lathyrus oleraceus]|uniref:uncharacterized protein LOC127095599 n=1 Tax=Pisum sativum TaxID=3888 RepID=UPI0021D022ED|nr:uncharacterized protein LOC127095599 [Pisum sativum]
MKNRIGKAVMNDGTPSKTVKKKVLIGLTKSWSKVVDPTRKMKEVSSSESDYDVEHDVQYITPQKKTVVRKILVNVPEAPLDNISFHFVNNVDRWKFIYQRRLDLERELGQDAFGCKEFMKLIEHAGLMKSVTGFGKFSEVLVKEFIRNIPTNCDDNKSKEFRKVFMRGKCIEFSPNVINRYMGRCEDEQPEIKVIGNNVCKEIATKQIARPRKGKLSARKLSVKYEMLHMIVNIPIASPSLICGIILSQNLSILNSVDAARKRESPLSLYSTSKAGLIAELKDTCKALDDTIKICTERKIRLERLIKYLFEESPDENMAGDAEKGDEKEEDVATGATSADKSDASVDI